MKVKGKNMKMKRFIELGGGLFLASALCVMGFVLPAGAETVATAQAAAVKALQVQAKAATLELSTGAKLDNAKKAGNTAAINADKSAIASEQIAYVEDSISTGDAINTVAQVSGVIGPGTDAGNDADASLVNSPVPLNSANIPGGSICSLISYAGISVDIVGLAADFSVIPGLVIDGSGLACTLISLL